jgi:hypothetical protein
MQQVKSFNVKWTLKDKNLQKLHHIIYIYIYGNFQFIPLNYFDITLTFF